MTWHNKVMWTEGMFLQPQHFQQQDRFVARSLEALASATLLHPNGFVRLAIDEAALLQGKFVLQNAVGLLPDGTPFSVPGEDPAPAALDVPTDTRDEPVVLGLAITRAGVAESDAEDGNAAMPPRFRVLDVEVADSHAQNVREAPLRIGRLNLKLMLARDANEGYTSLAVARIAERRADGRLVLDAQYIPPMLQAGAQPILHAYLREVSGLLHQRGNALAAMLAQPGQSGVGQVTDFLLLQTINRFEPQFVHAEALGVLHPERAYSLLLALAGDLSSFRDSRRPPAYPVYVHADPAPCFRAVMADLRQSLSLMCDPNAIRIELQNRTYGVRVALIADVELQRTASFVLAVNAQIAGEALRARFPTQAKIGPPDRIKDLVNLALPGVALRPLPVAPRQLPFHAGFSYFELETRGSDLWKQLEVSRSMAMFVPDDAFPGLELEFWAIRR